MPVIPDKTDHLTKTVTLMVIQSESRNWEGIFVIKIEVTWLIRNILKFLNSPSGKVCIDDKSIVRG